MRAVGEQSPFTSRDEQGVDRSLIVAMLRLSPEERLRLHDTLVRTVESLRHAFATRPR